MKQLAIVAVLLILGGFVYYTKFYQKDDPVALVRAEFMNSVQAAEAGDVGAQMRVAKMFEEGTYGANKDFYTALLWYEKAAQNGNANAQIKVAEVYFFGKNGIEKNMAEAAKWYKLLVQKNNIVAMNNLANLYMKGDGVPQDITYAVELYKKAAELGDEVAQYNLGRAYRDGRGVERNPQLARTWLEKSLAQGYADASLPLAKLLLQDENNSNLLEAQQLIKNIPVEEQNSIDYYSLMGDYYARLGKSAEDQYSSAYQWYSKAADQGDSYAYFKLAELLRQGLGVEKDFDQAIMMYQIADSHEGSRANITLAYLYLFNQDFPKNYDHAIEILQSPKYVRDKIALYYLSFVYQRGLGVAQDKVRAQQLVKQSCQLGHQEACNQLSH
ncbi:tetratricopeptide repeat protein [Wohlfahrtiimonas populi]|uniref:tetratricopeptide repeat protein n=1 Tax=Wohlfahrtiimonas populi TaxID=1940240 RepID=UPI00098D1AB4|nr:SEL1-like repeat protein [Wohlfahrtiimonas populi]